MYAKTSLANHPFANPHRGQHGKSGQFLGVYTRRMNGKEVRVLGPFDASRWLPHQGKREIARRLRQAAAQTARDEQKREFNRFARKLGMSREYGKLTDTSFVDNVYPEIIPQTPIGMDVLAPKKAVGEVQDPGNPVGKAVRWTSSGVLKVGNITHVVPAGKLPSDVGAKVKDATTPRDHESFVVEAVTTGAGVPAKKGSYWPRTSLLQF